MSKFLLRMRLAVVLRDGDVVTTLAKTVESPHIPQLGSHYLELGYDEPYVVEVVGWYPDSYTLMVELRPKVCTTMPEFENAVKRLTEYGWEVSGPQG